MTSVIRKIPCTVATPLTANNNILTFQQQNEGNAQMDMASSYIELEMVVNEADKTSICLGNSGIIYPPSAPYRQVSLIENDTGKTIQNLNYVNILDANLQYYATGCNGVLSNALFSGAPKKNATDNNFQSIFTNNYPDTNPVLKTPLSHLLPGSVGKSDLYPMSSPLSWNILLEPQTSFLQRVVADGVYDVGGEVLSVAYQINGPVIAGAPAQYTLTTAGDAVNFAVNQLIYCTFTVGAEVQEQYRVVTAINGAVLTLDSVLSALEINTISFQTVSNSHILAMQNFGGTGGSEFPLVTPQTNSASCSLYVGTTVKIVYAVYNSVDNSLTQKELRTTVIELLNPTPPPPSVVINGIKTKDGIANTNNVTWVVNAHVEPLYTNLSSNAWSVKNAHLVVYYKSIPMPRPENLLVSNFESVNVQCLANLNKFMYTLLMTPNTYNVYVMVVPSTNMMSSRIGDTPTEAFDKFLMYKNDAPLTSIYLKSDHSSLYLDMLHKVLSNSETYKPKNLRLKRDQEVVTTIEPTLFPAKIFQAQIKGEANVQDFNDSMPNFKIELLAQDGGFSTPNRTVYVFLEKFSRI